jgi:hypothetical protein
MEILASIKLPDIEISTNRLFYSHLNVLEIIVKEVRNIKMLILIKEKECGTQITGEFTEKFRQLEKDIEAGKK